MVINERYNFVFLRIPKNASTSLAIWFIKNAGNPSTDKWTAVHDGGINGSHGVDPMVLEKFKGTNRIIWHMTLQELIDNEIISKWHAQRKRIIGVVRDPFERQISLYYFLKRRHKLTGDDASNFRDIFRRGCHPTETNNQILQSDYFKIDGKYPKQMDIWPYDQIQTRLESFAKENKLKMVPLEKKKSGLRPPITNLADKLYDDRTRDAVRRYYDEDFKILEQYT